MHAERTACPCARPAQRQGAGSDRRRTGVCQPGVPESTRPHTGQTLLAPGRHRRWQLARQRAAPPHAAGPGPRRPAAARHGLWPRTLGWGHQPCHGRVHAPWPAGRRRAVQRTPALGLEQTRQPRHPRDEPGLRLGKPAAAPGRRSQPLRPDRGAVRCVQRARHLGRRHERERARRADVHPGALHAAGPAGGEHQLGHAGRPARWQFHFGSRDGPADRTQRRAAAGDGARGQRLPKPHACQRHTRARCIAAAALARTARRPHAKFSGDLVAWRCAGCGDQRDATRPRPAAAAAAQGPVGSVGGRRRPALVRPHLPQRLGAGHRQHLRPARAGAHVQPPPQSGHSTVWLMAGDAHQQGDRTGGVRRLRGARRRGAGPEHRRAAVLL